MSLFRGSNLLRRVNGGILPLKINSLVYFSDDKKPPKKNAENKKTDKSAADPIKTDTKERVNKLLNQLSSKSLDVVRSVQTSKPLGYKKILNKNVGETEPKKSKKASDAAEAVASEIGDDKVSKDLLKSIDVTPSDGKLKNLDEVIATMKKPQFIRNDRKKSTEALVGSYRTEQINTQIPNANENVNANANSSRRRIPLTKSYSKDKYQKPAKDDDNVPQTVSIEIFGGEPIGIFDPAKLNEQQDPLKTWNRLEKHEIRLSMSQAPRNYFEKMAYWTEEGKIWHFPIDNEQGLDDEKQISFTEHIFFDEKLEPWCPKRGAIRNFMELVCIGLSKNPYLTVQQKHEHIDWYRNYFEEKREILEHVAAEQTRLLKSQQTQQIDDGKNQLN